MNSPRVLAGDRQPRVMADFGQELLGSVDPPDRWRSTIAVREEGPDALTYVVGAVKVIGGCAPSVAAR